MLALKDANPGAFENDNINQLRRGQVLRYPSERQIRARSTQEAVREVMAQNEAYRSPRGDAASETVVQDSAADSASQAAGSGAAGDSGSGDDELRILVADNESGNGAGDIAGMGDGEGMKLSRRHSRSLTGQNVTGMSSSRDWATLRNRLTPWPS